jgi:hypothetical protein
MKACSRCNEQTELLNSHNNEFHSNAESKPKKEPFDKVSSIRGANTLFQGGEQNKNRAEQRSRSETQHQRRSKDPIREDQRS